MSKNKKADLSKIIINMENDKIIYRDTGKSLVIPYEGDDMNGTKPPKYFTDFATKVEDFMEKQLKFNDKVSLFMEQQLEFNKMIMGKVDLIMQCPTIKKEIAEITNKDA